ncbi:MAG: glycosyltransferase family 8 protein [Candidatus Paralactobacillus gallistercoris]|uniref:Glycosyltransferase family 8 protein n=1 Tax=Candidatus Paralactobacillus gallistercoris TaxID=2838724 RepID=A0A948TJY4_9LACO|nr:glycosyltransferase family 8 protein [Candidatus Paralactobacillus gallistercoris]
MDTTVIPVFFTIDNNFTKYVSVALQSLIDNVRADEKYHVIIIHQGLSTANQQALLNMANDNVEIELSYLNANLDAIQNRVENYLRVDFFTLTIYYRLFIADQFPQYDKAIYIDSDAVIPGNLADLYHMELGNNLIAAAPDHSIEHVPSMIKYIQDALGIKDYHTYLNSGVLLINMKAFRDEKFVDHFLYLLNKYHFDCIAPDQDYLNMICRGRILYLDEKWDAMPKAPEYADEKVANPQIVHYNLFYKPWHFDNVMYEKYFWQYADETAFAKEIHAVKDNYTDAQRQADVEKLDNLMRKAARLPATHNTFAKVAATGERIQL